MKCDRCNNKATNFEWDGGKGDYCCHVKTCRKCFVKRYVGWGDYDVIDLAKQYPDTEEFREIMNDDGSWKHGNWIHITEEEYSLRVIGKLMAV